MFKTVKCVTMLPKLNCKCLKEGIVLYMVRTVLEVWLTLGLESRVQKLEPWWKLTYQEIDIKEQKLLWTNQEKVRESQRCQPQVIENYNSENSKFPSVKTKVLQQVLSNKDKALIWCPELSLIPMKLKNKGLQVMPWKSC